MLALWAAIGNGKATVTMTDDKLGYIFEAHIKLKYGGHDIFTSQKICNVLELLGMYT